LEKHYEELRGLQLRDLFAEDPERGKRLGAEGSLDPPERLSARTLAPGKPSRHMFRPGVLARISGVARPS
jgi:hypothetical protein